MLLISWIRVAALGVFEVAGYDERGTLVRSPTKRQPVRQGVPTRADRLRSEIGQLEARYDSGAMPPGIYAVLKKMRAELAKVVSADK